MPYMVPERAGPGQRKKGGGDGRFWAESRGVAGSPAPPEQGRACFDQRENRGIWMLGLLRRLSRCTFTPEKARFIYSWDEGVELA